MNDRLKWAYSQFELNDNIAEAKSQGFPPRGFHSATMATACSPKPSVRPTNQWWFVFRAARASDWCWICRSIAPTITCTRIKFFTVIKKPTSTSVFLCAWHIYAQKMCSFVTPSPHCFTGNTQPGVLYINYCFICIFYNLKHHKNTWHSSCSISIRFTE